MNLKLEVQKRELVKKSELKTSRKNGYIPAVVYGEEFENVNIQIEKSIFAKQYKKSIGELAFFDLVIDGKEYRTIIKDKQIHPVSREILHVDFQVLHKGSPIAVHIPFKFIGEPVGIKTGGILEILQRNVEIIALPNDIVEDIEINLSTMEIGDSIHIK
ncbi:MAG: 50S ribosomal protein L25, partial [Candidatus Cloacimonetes bacterium]|nr:50S ribosomal protein L25 [Candidatus Cloacimonadota bacterium]